MNLPPVLRQRYLDANGNPLAGGKLYTYQAGTSTPQATYTDSAGGTPNTNPVVLDANGEAEVWLNPEWSYKFVLKNSNDVTQWITDNVIGLLTADAVATPSLQDGAVTTPKLANGSVTSAKLASSASIDLDRPVGTDNIKDSSVTTAKIADSAVATAKLADTAVTTGKLANGAVTTPKLADGAVTQAKRAALGEQAANLATTTANNGAGMVAVGSVGITTTGRPVMILLVPDGAALAGIQLTAPSNANTNATIQITRDGTVIYLAELGVFPNGVTGVTAFYPPSCISTVDTGASAGAHTYALSAQWGGSAVSGTFVSLFHCKLVAFEL